MRIDLEPTATPISAIGDTISVILSRGVSVSIALVLVLAGASVIFSYNRWQKNGQRVEGEIVSYIKKKDGDGDTFYYPVYRYVDLRGIQQEKTSLFGFRSIIQNKLGRKIELLIHPEDPDDIRETDNKTSLYIGWILLSCAIVPLTSLPLLGSDGIITLLLIAPAAFYAHRRIRAYAAGERHFLDAGAPAVLAQKGQPISIGEAIEQDQKSSALSGVLALVIAALLSYGGYFFYTDVRHLTEDGLRTEATVTGFTYSSNDSYKKSSSKHAELTFQDTQGRTFTFSSGYGGDLFDYKVGDKKQILYLAENPQGTAEIDLGLFNWAIPVGLWIFAALCLSGGLSRLSKQTRQKTL